MSLTQDSLARFVSIVSLEKFGVEESRALVTKAEGEEVVSSPEVSPQFDVNTTGTGGAHRQLQEHQRVLRRDQGMQELCLLNTV